MINEAEDFSSGYFDLVFTDECHRSIYGKWSGVLKVNHGKPHRSNLAYPVNALDRYM